MQSWYDARVVKVTTSNTFLKEKMLTPLKSGGISKPAIEKSEKGPDTQTGESSVARGGPPCLETLYGPVFTLLQPLMPATAPPSESSKKNENEPANEAVSNTRKLKEIFDYVLFSIQYDGTGEIENCRYFLDEGKLYTSAGHENIEFKWKPSPKKKQEGKVTQGCIP